MPLALALVKPYCKKFPKFADEFYSAAMYALVLAARAYQEGKDAVFATYLRFRISGALRDEYKLMLDSSDICHGLEASWTNIRQNLICDFADDPTKQIIDDDAFERIIKGLHNREKEILRLAFVYDLSESKIALVFGLSQSGISRIKKDALTHLRNTG